MHLHICILMALLSTRATAYSIVTGTVHRKQVIVYLCAASPCWAVGARVTINSCMEGAIARTGGTVRYWTGLAQPTIIGSTYVW
ncbi:hypothetical protein F4801DRAFT_525819 [Xylaria longipes]|nr:hypothetical protein F4801DRAFT_525819 [Xylaria longipes]